MKQGSLKALIEVLRNPAWLCFAWTGVAAGVTLIAIPAIFGAPGTDRADAIGVASALFASRDRVEIVMLVLLLVLVRASASKRGLMFPALGVALIMVLQSAWLLPQLVERSAQIVSGITPDPSYAHAAYSLLEIAKVVLLLYLAFVSMHVFRRA